MKSLITNMSRILYTRLIIYVLAFIGLSGCGKVQFQGGSSPSLKSSDEVISDDRDMDVDLDIDDDVEVDVSDETEGMKATCDFYRKELQNTPAQDKISIIKVYSALDIKANHIVEITDSFGAVVVVGVGENARIDRISNHYGAMVLCGVSVGVLENSTGAVGIYGSLEKVINHKGALVVERN